MAALLRLLLLALLVGPLAGCAQEAATPEPRAPALLLLDGRWEIPRATLERHLDAAGMPRPVGALLAGEGILVADDAAHPVDFVGLDAGALALVAPQLAAPAPGGVVLDAAYAQARGLAVGDRVEARAASWPTPLVSTFFEMDRTRPCAEATSATKLCFLPFGEGAEESRLQLRAGDGAHDLAFLPDLAELGAEGTPAWWNGSFTSPSGRVSPFSAYADKSGHPTPAEVQGAVEPGTWTISFRLEAAGKLIPGGVAGIVRIREPGYLWFDDRIPFDLAPQQQGDVVLGMGREHQLPLHVARIEPFPASLRAFDAVLALPDAQALQGAHPDDASIFVLNVTPADREKLTLAKQTVANGLVAALRLRDVANLTHARAEPAPRPEALVARAPLDVDVATLPRVEGAGEPVLVAATRSPLAERVRLDARDVGPVRILAPATSAGHAMPFQLPAGARWSTPDDALENLSRSRTLVLASADLTAATTSVQRLLFGEEGNGRVAVVVDSVRGGPPATVWGSAPLVAGAGEPVGARVVVPLLPGADADAVRARLAEAWGALGLAVEA